jgi:O-antigen/teichoic acid export membrane protein
MKFKFVAGIDLASTVTGSVITLVLAWLGGGVWSLIGGSLAGGVLRTALYVTLGTYVRPSPTWRGIGKHVRFGGAVTATRALWQLTYQADMLVAGRFLLPQAVGLYSVSMHLATLPMTKAMGIVNQVAFPAMARLQGELPRMRQRLLSSLRLLAFAAIPALWGISAAAPEFIDVILGDRWHGAIVPLQIVSFIAPLRMLSAVLATALAALGRADLELRNTIVSAIVLPIAFLIGVQHGLNGLAMSWLVAIPVTFAINFPLTWRTVGIELRQLLFAMRAPLLAGVVMYACVYCARLPLAGFDELTRLPVLIAAGGLGYLGALFLLDRTIVRDVKRLAVAVRG